MIIILLLINLCNCSIDNKDKIIKKPKYEPFPVLNDILDIGKYLQFYEKKNLDKAKFEFFYLGKYKDTLNIGSPINFNLIELDKDSDTGKIQIFNSFAKYSIDWMEFGGIYKYSNTSLIEILIDTSKRIRNSIPILLTNLETDTIFIGYGDYVSMILEAQDSTKKWRPIQERYQYSCGNGVGVIFLPPKECVLTFAPIFNGNYKTQLRLALGKNYSEPFEGTINYGQFSQK